VDFGLDKVEEVAVTVSGAVDVLMEAVQREHVSSTTVRLSSPSTSPGTLKSPVMTNGKSSRTS